MRIFPSLVLCLLSFGLLCGLAVAQDHDQDPGHDRNPEHGHDLGRDKDDDDALARDRFEMIQQQNSTVAAAEGEMSAWVRLQRIPFWRDASGAVPHWEEIGPRVIEHGWGDMENAGRTSAVAIDATDPRVVFAAAASGGLWKSTDACATWRPVGDREASLSFGAITIDPFDHNVIYAGTGEAHFSADSFSGLGMLRSRDGGEHWELLATDVFIGQRFARIDCDPHRPGFLYAATTGGVYRSTDGGGTWVRLLKGPATDMILDLSHPNQMIAAIGATSGGPLNGIYKSVDAGDSWQKLTEGLPVDGKVLGRLQMDSCASYPNVIYVSFYGNNARLAGLYKSNDFGESWVLLPSAPNYGGGQSWYDNYLSVSPVNPNVVFVGGTSTYRTLDGGVSWTDNTRSYDGGPIHPDHHRLVFDPTDAKTAYLCTDGGVFRTRNVGESWQSVSRGLGTVQFQSVDVHPTDAGIAYGGTQDNGTNKYEGSPFWRNSIAGDGGVTRVNWREPNVVYGEYVDLTIIKTKDAGANWDWDVTNGIEKREGALFYAPFNLDPSNPDVLVAGTTRVYRSTDGAGTWRPISPVLGRPLSAITIAPNNPAVIYAGTSDGRVWVTPDEGKQWFEISAGLPKAYVGDIQIDPRNARHLWLGQTGWGGNRLWESHDAGGTWTRVGVGLPSAPVNAICIDPRRPDRVYVGTQVGVFVTQDSGLHWFRFGQGLPNVPVFSIVANPRTHLITIGTHGRGAWRIAYE